MCCSISSIYKCHISLCSYSYCIFDTVVVVGQQLYPVKAQKAGFSNQSSHPWWDLFVSKQQGTSIVALRQAIKNCKIRKWNTNHYNMMLVFYFLWKLINVRGQILKNMNVNVAAFPTALIDVNILGSKCHLQNVIRTRTLCLIWCFCLWRGFWVWRKTRLTKQQCALYSVVCLILPYLY